MKLVLPYKSAPNPLGLPAEWPAVALEDDGRTISSPWIRESDSVFAARISANLPAYNVIANALVASAAAAQAKELSWSAELNAVWTDGPTGIALRQDEQTRSIATALLAASAEGVANGSLTGATQVQIRDANGTTRTGTVTQLRGLCYRYLTAWLANYVTKAP